MPYSNTFKKTHKPVEITLPPILADKSIKEIRIIPKSNARFFEIQYTYEAEYTQRNLNQNKKASFWDKDHIPVYNADNPQKYQSS